MGHSNLLSVSCSPYAPLSLNQVPVYYLVYVAANVLVLFPTGLEQQGYRVFTLDFSFKVAEYIASSHGLTVCPHSQMVPWASLWARRREAPYRKGQIGQLPGARKPEQTGRLCAVRPHQRGEARERGPQDQSHTRHDPVPSKRIIPHSLALQ